jgi:hypothetical protein
VLPTAAVAVLLVVMGLAIAPLYAVAERAGLELADPSAYLAAVEATRR